MRDFFLALYIHVLRLSTKRFFFVELMPWVQNEVNFFLKGQAYIIKVLIACTCINLMSLK